MYAGGITGCKGLVSIRPPALSHVASILVKLVELQKAENGLLRELYGRQHGPTRVECLTCRDTQLITRRLSSSPSIFNASSWPSASIGKTFKTGSICHAYKVESGLERILRGTICLSEGLSGASRHPHRDCLLSKPNDSGFSKLWNQCRGILCRYKAWRCIHGVVRDPKRTAQSPPREAKVQKTLRPKDMVICTHQGRMTRTMESKLAAPVANLTPDVAQCFVSHRSHHPSRVQYKQT